MNTVSTNEALSARVNSRLDDIAQAQHDQRNRIDDMALTIETMTAQLVGPIPQDVGNDKADAPLPSGTLFELEQNTSKLNGALDRLQRALNALRDTGIVA